MQECLLYLSNGCENRKFRTCQKGTDPQWGPINCLDSDQSECLTPFSRRDFDQGIKSLASWQEKEKQAFPCPHISILGWNYFLIDWCQVFVRSPDPPLCAPAYFASPHLI